MPTLTAVTLDLANGSGGLTGSKTFNITDLGTDSITRKCPGATLDEGYVMNEDARTLKNGVRQVRTRIAHGIVDGEGASRLLGTVSVNRTLQFPAFATTAQINEILSLLEARKDGIEDSEVGASNAIGGNLP